MSDKLVYDLALEVEGSPSIFIRKDWINILDNMTSNYTANQSVIDTSQLSNSNKYMSYREAYFLIPMTLTLASLQAPTEINLEVSSITNNGAQFLPASGGADFDRYADSAIGLKSWFGNIIHSFTVDMNGSTIIQQTPFINMWNCFKLNTSLSYQDILTQGTTIGYYLDDAETFEYYDITKVTDNNGNVVSTSVLSTGVVYSAGAPIETVNGTGASNNSNRYSANTLMNQGFQGLRGGLGNTGFMERQKWICFDPLGKTGKNFEVGSYNNSSSSYGNLIKTSQLEAMWKSYIAVKRDQVVNDAGAQTTCGLLSINITACVYLKHIHSFFNMCPLLKGVFCKMTMNLNNSASTVIVGCNIDAINTTDSDIPTGLYSVPVQSSTAIGGVNPMMLASINSNNGANGLIQVNPLKATANGLVSITQPYRMSLSVGAVCLDNLTTSLAGYSTNPAQCKSVYLYIPAYTFNAPFEKSYISSPVKTIKYTDVYQYQIQNVSSGSNVNSLLTNGIANIKSVLILPFHSSNGVSVSSGSGALGALPTGTNVGTSLSPNSSFLSGVPVYASVYDPAGCGPTSPLCHFTNFNVQVSGQNAIYNLQLRLFEQFNHNLAGVNSVNGGLTDGICSSMLDKQAFDLEYCYYYVNVERMLPVEQVVPKSVQLVGTSQSSKDVDLIAFIEYGAEVKVDVLTGARV